MKNSKGRVVTIICTVVIAIILLVVTWCVGFRKSTTDSMTQLQASGWKTYSNSSLGFSFQYPNNLTLVDITAQQPSDVLAVQLISASSSMPVLYAAVQNWTPEYSTLCSHSNDHLQQQKSVNLTFDQVSIHGIQYLREEALSEIGAGNDFSYSLNYSASNAQKQCYDFGFDSNPIYKPGTTSQGKDSISNLDMDSEKQAFMEILQTVKIN